jgi:hypothetical protein
MNRSLWESVVLPAGPKLQKRVLWRLKGTSIEVCPSLDGLLWTMWENGVEQSHTMNWTFDQCIDEVERVQSIENQRATAKSFDDMMRDVLAKHSYTLEDFHQAEFIRFGEQSK